MVLQVELKEITVDDLEDLTIEDVVRIEFKPQNKQGITYRTVSVNEGISVLNDNIYLYTSKGEFGDVIPAGLVANIYTYKPRKDQLELLQQTYDNNDEYVEEVDYDDYRPS